MYPYPRCGYCTICGTAKTTYNHYCDSCETKMMYYNYYNQYNHYNHQNQHNMSNTSSMSGTIDVSKVHELMNLLKVLNSSNIQSGLNVTNNTNTNINTNANTEIITTTATATNTIIPAINVETTQETNESKITPNVANSTNNVNEDSDIDIDLNAPYSDEDPIPEYPRKPVSLSDLFPCSDSDSDSDEDPIPELKKSVLSNLSGSSTYSDKTITDVVTISNNNKPITISVNESKTDHDKRLTRVEPIINKPKSRFDDKNPRIRLKTIKLDESAKNYITEPYEYIIYGCPKKEAHRKYCVSTFIAKMLSFKNTQANVFVMGYYAAYTADKLIRHGYNKNNIMIGSTSDSKHHDVATVININQKNDRLDNKLELCAVMLDFCNEYGEYNVNYNAIDIMYYVFDNYVLTRGCIFYFMTTQMSRYNGIHIRTQFLNMCERKKGYKPMYLTEIRNYENTIDKRIITAIYSIN